MKNTLLILVCSIFIISCNQYTVVSTDQQSVDSFLIKPSHQWNLMPKQFALSGLPTWTVDGGTLNSLTFISEVEDGKPLLPDTNEKKYEKFKSDMLPTEVVELIESSFLLTYNAKTIKEGQLKPIKIGADQGFQYEFEFISSDEIPRKGYVAAAVKNKMLHLIFFQATKLHYYDSLIEDVKNMVTSATIKA